MRKRFLSPVLSLLLLFSLLLSGCTSGSDGGSGAGTPSPSPSAQPSETPVDFSKYNTYLEILNNVYEMGDLLSVYFSVVQNQPEFALADGMEYGMLKDEFTGYTFLSHTMEDAVEYSQSEPSYPEQDTLIAALNEPYCEVGGILADLAWYVTFSTYEEDDMAEAIQLHTQLYEAAADFDAVAWDFADAMAVLDQQTEQQSLDYLKESGVMIGYYCQLTINLCNDISDEVWLQIMDVEGLPPLDMTNLDALYAQYQEAYAKLTEALADPDQQLKIRRWQTGFSSDILYENFTGSVEDLDPALSAFLEDARAQADYEESYNAFYDAVSELIDDYNSSIAS